MVATPNPVATQAPASQAARVIAKFGGAIKLAKLLGVEESTVFRWDYPRSKGGTDGIIPGKSLRRVLQLAQQQSISITPADLYPTA